MLLASTVKPWLPLFMAAYGLLLVLFPKVGIGLSSIRADLKGFSPAKRNLFGSPNYFRSYGAVLIVLAFVVQEYGPV